MPRTSARISDRRCPKCGVLMRHYTLKNSNHNGKKGQIYQYEYFKCNPCQWEKRKQKLLKALDMQVKINMLSALSVDV